MSSYHSSFTYNNINSADKNLIITAFEPDNSLMETFLSMDPVYEDCYDGTKRFDYGARYNSTATVKITVIKNNGKDFLLEEVRSHLKWLTGSRVNSWLDLYIGKQVTYSFLGRVTNVQQQKMDARTIGLTITFTSVSPWAYSLQQFFEEDLDKLFVDANGILHKGILVNNARLSIDENGALYNNNDSQPSWFKVTDDGIAYFDRAIVIEIDNQSDDLYTYINLDTKFTNVDSDSISIKNTTLDEESTIINMSQNEKIAISAEQFIVSDIPNKIFGNNFNFVWPRLAPGVNEIVVDAPHKGSIQFSYRYPMKVGDCAINIDAYGGDINCNNYPDNSDTNGEIFTGTIAWKNITDTPSTIDGYGITDAYTIKEIDNKIENIEVNGDIGSANVNEQDLNEMLKNVLD